MAAVALAVSGLTIYSRQWFIGKGLPYESVWPARYYLVQTMLMAGFLCLVLWRCGELWPGFRKVAIGLTVGMGLNFAMLQAPHLEKVLGSVDPAVAARRWIYQLGRVKELYTLTGDLGRSEAERVPVLIDVPMYIDGHAVPVPSALLAKDLPSSDQRKGTRV